MISMLCGMMLYSAKLTGELHQLTSQSTTSQTENMRSTKACEAGAQTKSSATMHREDSRFQCTE